MTTTPHDPAVQALIDAARSILMSKNASETSAGFEILRAAFEALRPKPEMEKVLPDLMDMPPALLDWYRASGLKPYEWIKLVTLTMRLVQKQKWNMPEWGDFKKDHDDEFETSVGWVSKNSYEALRAKILSLNEELPPTTDSA